LFYTNLSGLTEAVNVFVTFLVLQRLAVTVECSFVHDAAPNSAGG